MFLTKDEKHFNNKRGSWMRIWNLAFYTLETNNKIIWNWLWILQSPILTLCNLKGSAGPKIFSQMSKCVVCPEIGTSYTITKLQLPWSFTVVTYAAFPVVTSPVCLLVRLAFCDREVRYSGRVYFSKFKVWFRYSGALPWQIDPFHGAKMLNMWKVKELVDKA